MEMILVEYCLIFLFLIGKSYIECSCDIFFYNKCPLPPVTIQINIAAFCFDAKKHVDCINRRLENCTEVQEYGPALETLKLNFKVYLTQATSHGCHDLYDQIRIPRRLPRTRPSTKKPRRSKKRRRTTIASIEYHCQKKVFSDSCGKWNHSSLLLNRTNCHHAFQYIQCVNPLKLKCQNLFSQNEEISQIEYFLQKCYKTLLKPLTNQMNSIHLKFNIFLFNLILYWTLK